MVGSLKTSVSQLEYQNDELQRQVAGLKAENRRFEDRLVQERAENQRLASQLDGAKERLGEPASDTRTGSRSSATDDDDDPRRRRVGPVPPAAAAVVAIPGRIEPARPVDDDDMGSAQPAPRGRLASRRAVDDRWLPVARGIGSGQASVK